MRRAIVAAILALVFTVAPAARASAALVQLKLAPNCSQHINVAFILQICYEFGDEDDGPGNGPPG